MKNITDETLKDRILISERQKQTFIEVDKLLEKWPNLKAEEQTKHLNNLLHHGIPFLEPRDRKICIKKLNEGRIISIKEATEEVNKWAKSLGIDDEKKEEPEQEDEVLKFSLSETDKEQTLSLLKDPNLINRFLEILDKLGCVGEEDNKLLIGLTLVSRILNEPINLIVKGESAGGKSYLVQKVAQLFPQEDIIQRTRLTQNALYYFPNRNLQHKVLIIYERFGSQDSDYSIRSIQSEKKLILSYPAKNKKTGKIETVDIEIKGPIACIETTTQPHLNLENETRCFDIYIDESEEQTQKIFKSQDKEVSLTDNELSEEENIQTINLWRNTQRLLQVSEVVIPFVSKIKFPTQPLRVRRDRKRFLALIQASAVWHQYQRERSFKDGKEYIVANIEDYTLAYRLAYKILGRIVKGISDKGEILVNTCWQLAKENNLYNPEDYIFTRSDVEKRLKWSRPTTKKYLKEAVSVGCLELIEGSKGKEYKYKIVKRVKEIATQLLRPEEFQEELNIKEG